jgi:hypothetical protein
MGWGAEGIYVYTVEGAQAEGCGTSTMMMDPAHPLLDENYSLLLLAFSTGKRVRVYIDGCIQGRMNLMAVSIDDAHQ